MPDIEFSFKDNTVVVKKVMNTTVGAALLEVSADIVSQTARNTRVDTGQLKGSWAAYVDESDTRYTAVIGSPLKNAIWEEFGTGEYAANGDGRQGGWLYEDRHGETIFTRGKYPTHAFEKAYLHLKSKTIRKIQQAIKGALR